MSDGWRCSVCGCTTYHYNSGKRHFVCDSCAKEILSAEDERRQLCYLQTVDRAKDNLCVGSWESAKNLARPLTNDYPRDKVLYLILLASVTKGYSDYMFGVSNRACREEASALWDKLVRLHAVNSTMTNYASRRLAAVAAECEKITVRILLAAFFLFIGIVMAGALKKYLFVIILLVLAGLLVKRAIDPEICWFFSEMRKLKRNTNGNPF